MIHLAIQQLRRRGLRYVSLFFAVFASVALTVAATALTFSVVTNVNQLFSKPYQEADFVITVNADNNAAVGLMAEDIAAVPGVQAVSFQQNSVAFLREPDGIYQDIAVQTVEPGPLQWRSIIEGRIPKGPDEIALAGSGGVPSLGSQVSLRVASNAEDRTLTVVGIMEPSAEEIISGASSALVPAQTMQEWGLSSSRGEFLLSTINVSMETLNRAVSSSEATTSVSTATAHTEGLSDSYLGSRDQYFLLLFAFVLVATAVAFLVIFSAYSVISGERTREFGLIRAVGSSTQQIIGSAVIEACILGVVAAGAGVPTGLFAAQLLAQEADRFGVRFPIENVSAPAEVLLFILLIGITMPVLAALPATVNACRQSTVTALTSSAVIRSHPLTTISWWLLTMGVGVASAWIFRWLERAEVNLNLLMTLLASGLAALFVLLILALTLPSLVERISRLLGRVPIPSVQLGMAFAGRQKIRAAALVAIVVAGSGLSSAVIHGQAQIRNHLLITAVSMGGSDLRVTALDEQVPPTLVEEISELPGVSAAVAPSTTTISFSETATATALILDDATGDKVLRGHDIGAPPGTVILGRSSALQNLLPPNTEVTAEIGGESVLVKVLHSSDYPTLVHPDVVQRARESTAAELGISSSDLPQQPIRSLLILLEGPAHQDAQNPIIDSVRNTISAYPGRYSITEGFTARNNTLDLTNRISTMSTLLTLVALLIAAVGLINTVALTVVERSRDRALLRSIGLTRSGQVLVTISEIISLSLPSSLIGAIVGGHLGLYVAGIATDHRNIPLTDWGSLTPELILILTIMMTLGSIMCALLIIWGRRNKDL